VTGRTSAPEEPSVTLCCVAGGAVYVRYARHLEESAEALFTPGARNRFELIAGEEGWPSGTMFRWHRLLENMPCTDYVFLCDADMRCEGPIGPEILSPHVTVTIHPGFVGVPADELPYERRPASSCRIPPGAGSTYFAGAFVGGPRAEVIRFATAVADLIDQDVRNGVTPVWHDESALNKVASIWSDLHVLDPSMCYPDDDSEYVKRIWTRPYERKLVALDKAGWERAGRTPRHGPARRALEAVIGRTATDRLRRFVVARRTN